MLSADGPRKVALCEVGDDVRERVASQYELERLLYENSMMCRCRISMQRSSALPRICIFRWRCNLAKAGIGILIEKPLSMSLAGIRRTGRTGCGKSNPCLGRLRDQTSSGIAGMKQAIDTGRFGSPVQIVANGGQHFPFYRPAYRETYYTGTKLAAERFKTRSHTR